MIFFLFFPWFWHRLRGLRPNTREIHTKLKIFWPFHPDVQCTSFVAFFTSSYSRHNIRYRMNKLCLAPSIIFHLDLTSKMFSWSRTSTKKQLEQEQKCLEVRSKKLKKKGMAKVFSFRSSWKKILSWCVRDLLSVQKHYFLKWSV